MNIGLVTTSYPRYDGDCAGVFTHLLAVALRQLGHQVHVVAPESAGADVEAPGDISYVRFRPRLARHLAYGGGIVENLRKRPYLLLALPGFIRSIRSAACRELRGCEVLDASFTAAGIALAGWKNRASAIVYTGHGTDIHLLEKSLPYRWYFRKILGRFNRISVVSSYLADQVRRYGCDANPVVIPNGVPKEALNVRVAWRPEPTVIFASRLIKLKRPGLLLRAWQSVVRSLPDAKLSVFGDGALGPQLKSVARDMGIGCSVVFHGMTSQEALWREIGKGWITVLPSLREGFPPILLESLAVGTPFLSSPVGGASEIARETGGGVILPEPLDPDILSENIVSMLTDREGLERRGESARLKVANAYSWEAIARKKVLLYQEAIEAHHWTKDHAVFADSGKARIHHRGNLSDSNP